MMPVCPHCQDTLTVQYILIDCVHFADMRIRWKFPATLRNLLGEYVNLNNLVKFIHDVYLYNEIWFYSILIVNFFYIYDWLNSR